MAKKRFVLILLISLVAVGMVTLICRDWWRLRLREARIKRLLPRSAFLREINPIPDVSPESYLVIYIKEPKFDEVPEDKTDLYMTCPESVGQQIEGTYHLALFQNNSFVNDLIIPPGKQKLSFRNTRINIHGKFNGPKPSKREEIELERVKLIDLKDYTGDGKKHEFRLTGGVIACGHTNYLMAGYDSQKNRVVIYSIIDGEESFYWHDNFLPNSSGRVEWHWLCGDHGAPTSEYKTYQFDSEKRAYVLVEEREDHCP